MRGFCISRRSCVVFSSEPRLALAFAVLALAVAGCSRRDPAGGPSVSAATAALNASPKLGDFVLEAQNSIRLQTGGAVVNGGDIGARGTGSGPFLAGGVAIDLLTGVQTQTTHNIIADSVQLGTGDTVGDIQTNRFINGVGTTHGKISALVPLPALPAACGASPGSSNLTVGTGATVTASPGQFAAVSVGTGGKLRLNSGQYDMASLTVGTGAQVQALGSVQLRVAGRLSTSSGSFIGAASGTTLTARDVHIEVSGQNGTTGSLGATPPAASLGTGNVVTALILVPNGTLSMGTGIVATGAFMARDIDVGGAGARIVFQDGFAACSVAGCDDGNLCTVDSCNTCGECTHVAAPAGTSCSDGNPCNGAEACDGAGHCSAGTPVSCTALDQCHAAGVCDSATGLCSNPAKSDGTSCNDGKACTKNDVCKAGTCGGTTYTCSDGLACTTDTCNGDGTCAFSVTAENCLIGGACVASAAINPLNPCQKCMPATSQTAWSPTASGTACNDGNACTKNDVCNGAGQCGGTPYACSDGLACTVDACNGDGTCSFVVAPGNCVIGGGCYGAGATSPTNQCQQCAPGASQTTWSPKDNGTACNDGNACTKNDQCTAGSCGGTAYSCDDGLACTADSCSGDGTCTHTIAAGSCLVGGACYGAGATSPTNQCQQCTPSASQTAWSPKNNGTACNDGNVCTKNDVCTAGACAGTTYSCNDGMACTADSCNGDGTCTFSVTAGNCLIDGACFASGAGNPLNPCQRCAPATSQTAWSPTASGTACNDGNACTKNDVCNGAGVCGGTAYTCSDGMACTTDTCNGDGTCTFAPLPGNCAIGGACYAAGSTSPANQCQQCTPGSSQTAWSPKDNGTLCDDGNACTKNDVCAAGVCGGTAYSCDDGLDCTADSCKGDGTCSHTVTAGNCLVDRACYGAGTTSPTNQCQQCTPGTSQTAWSPKNNGNACNDGNACTQTDSCQGGACTGSNLVKCSASDQCHDVGECNPSNGLCGNPAKADGTSCDDGNASSQGDACTAGVCQGTIPCAAVADIRVGAAHSCAVRADGSLWCWGANGAGQLGNGTTTDSRIPVRTGAATWNWASVSAGESHSCTTLCIDNYGGARAAVDLLLSLGRQRIGAAGQRDDRRHLDPDPGCGTELDDGAGWPHIHLRRAGERDAVVLGRQHARGPGQWHARQQHGAC